MALVALLLLFSSPPTGARTVSALRFLVLAGGESEDDADPDASDSESLDLGELLRGPDVELESLEP